MALPKYTEPHYRIWHYVYIFICACVFFFLIAPLFVIFPLSFNAEEFLSFSEGMKNLDPDAFSLRWYKDMIYGTKNPWGLAAKNNTTTTSSKEVTKANRPPEITPGKIKGNVIFIKVLTGSLPRLDAALVTL